MMNDDLFDIKMRTKFKEEVNEIPEVINQDFTNTLTFIRNQEDGTMKRFLKRKKVGIIAASIVCALTLTMQTTFAQDLVKQIIKSLSLNNITIFENQGFKWEDRAMPEAAKGKVFDQSGNVIQIITADNQDKMYTANGEQVLGVEDDGTILTEALLQQRAASDPPELVIKDASKLKGYTCFDIKLPAYLPKGFEFDNATFYRDDTGVIIDDACNLTFINHKTEETIYMDQRYVCKAIAFETSFETSFDNIEKVKVNDADAIIGDEGITWESGGISYFMYTYDLGRAESIKIAESIK